MSRKRSKKLIKRPTVKQEFKKEEKKSNRNKKILVAFILIQIMLMVFVMNAVFNYNSGVAYNENGETWKEQYLLSGPDPYYNMRTVDQVLETGHYPWREDVDHLLNYPVGHVGSARPPLMNMMAIGMSKLLTPFMSQGDAIGLSMQFLPAIFGVLLVLPVYFIGKTLYGYKIGILSALFISIIPIHLGSGHGSAFSLFDHDSINLFLFAMTFLFFIYGIKSKDKSKTIMFGILGGICIGGLSMVWVSAHYLYVLIAFFFGIATIINVFRSKFNIHLTLTAFCILATGFLIYLPLGFTKIIELTMVVFVLGLSLIVYITRKWPWVITIPAFGSATAGGFYFLFLIRNTTIGWLNGAKALSNIVFGSGIYGTEIDITIAEAKTFAFSRNVMSFGPALLPIAFVGLVLTLIHWFKNKDKIEYLFVSFVFIADIWLITTAGRFINDLVPFVCLFSAYTLWIFVEKLDLKGMIRNIRSVGGLRGIKKAVSIVQLGGILFIAFIVIAPTTFVAMDSAIPLVDTYEYFDEEHKPAFGLGLYKEQYWIDALMWLNERDLEIEKPEDRPAFISWWDYGFYEVAVGEHPTVADNFQEGIPTAANFQIAQSEREAVSIIILRLLEGELRWNNNDFSNETLSLIEQYLPENKDIIDSEGNVTGVSYPRKEFIEIMKNPEKAPSFGTLVDKNYGQSEDFKINELNARIHDCSKIITDNVIEEENLTQFLMEIEESTGYSIRYYGVEGYDMLDIFGVFPFLADKGLQGIVTMEDDYRITKLIGSDGVEYTLEQYQNLTEEQYESGAPFTTRTYDKDGFYNSMVYKVYQLAGGGLRHFRIGYVSPYPYPGTSKPAVFIMQYWPGAKISGRLTFDDFPGYYKTVGIKDEYGVFHDLTYTDENGNYELTSVPGNITISVFEGDNMLGNSTNITISENAGNRIEDYYFNLDIKLGTSNVSGYITNFTDEHYVEMDTLISELDKNGHFEFNDIIPGEKRIFLMNSTGEVKYETHFVPSGNFTVNMTVPDMEK